MKYLQTFGCLLLALAVSQSVLAQKVYTWTDAKGVVHYGEHPPKNVKATLVKTRTGHSDPTPAPAVGAQPATAATSAAQPAAANAAAALKDPERCSQARANLDMLNTVARIRTQNADGVMVYLPEEDKAQQRTTMQQIIDQACE